MADPPNNAPAPMSRRHWKPEDRLAGWQAAITRLCELTNHDSALLENMSKAYLLMRHLIRQALRVNRIVNLAPMVARQSAPAALYHLPDFRHLPLCQSIFITIPKVTNQSVLIQTNAQILAQSINAATLKVLSFHPLVVLEAATLKHYTDLIPRMRNIRKVTLPRVAVPSQPLAIKRSCLIAWVRLIDGSRSVDVVLRRESSWAMLKDLIATGIVTKLYLQQNESAAEALHDFFKLMGLDKSLDLEELSLCDLKMKVAERHLRLQVVKALELLYCQNVHGTIGDHLNDLARLQALSMVHPIRDSNTTEEDEYDFILALFTAQTLPNMSTMRLETDIPFPTRLLAKKNSYVPPDQVKGSSVQLYPADFFDSIEKKLVHLAVLFEKRRPNLADLEMMAPNLEALETLIIPLDGATEVFDKGHEVQDCKNAFARLPGILAPCRKLKHLGLIVRPPRDNGNRIRRHTAVASETVAPFINADRTLEMVSVISRKDKYRANEVMPLAVHFRVLNTRRVEVMTNLTRAEKDRFGFLGLGMDRKVQC